ncbi:MAG TPA: 1,4-alpha-glucan branching enzyme, partial [Burkholderiaceae bacterium]|nr:1,4-alpha-glucan branching enzyme [Burkholderiaceae bacterium]
MAVKETSDQSEAAPKQERSAGLTAHDVYLFKEGTHARLYQRLGCQLRGQGARFGVWAPNAESVAVVGEFNGWRRDAHALAPREDGSGIWEGYIEGVRAGQTYKYSIATR